MLIFGITRLFNRTAAPKLLSWGLRLRETSPLLSGRVLLPLAQGLVSIEARDDYRRLALSRRRDGGGGGDGGGKNDVGGGGGGDGRTAWDDFVDDTWNFFFEDRRRDGRRSRGGADAGRRDREGAEEEVGAHRRPREDGSHGRRRPPRRRRGTMATRHGHDDRHGDHDHEDDIDDDDESLKSHGEQRVRLLGRYVLPALLSSTSTADLNPRRHDDRFVRWMRGEYLMARYGPIVERALANHPELRHHDRRDDIDDIVDDLDHLLPSAETVRRAFDMEGWSRHKAPLSSWEEEDEDDDGERNREGEDHDRDDLERIVHYRLRGHVANSGPLNAYFEMRGRDDSYELWTREYVRGLARYLLDRIEEMDGERRRRRNRRRAGGKTSLSLSSAAAAKGIRTTILDIGAGDGRLAYFLRLAMREIVGGARGRRGVGTRNSSELPVVVATDDGSWKAPIYDGEIVRDDDDDIAGRRMFRGVERLTVTESLEKYGPRTTTENSRLIVLCSWMPPGRDWTADFRRPIVPFVDNARDDDDNNDDPDCVHGDDIPAAVERLVEEYILVGEADDGTCGHNWLTWGNPDFRDVVTERGDNDRVDKRRTNDDVRDAESPPYVLDGYVREDLEELSMMQFSRFDCKRSRESKTVSFRRRVGS